MPSKRARSAGIMCALAAGFAALGVARLTAVAAESASASDSPHVVFVVGEGEYGSQESMPALADVLSTRYGLRVTVLIDSELDAGPDNSIGGLNSLETADLAIFFMRFRQLPDTQLAEIQRYLDRGGPVVASRTTTHAFAYDAEDPRAEKWNAFGARELGAPWIHHYGHDASTDATTEGEHPILNGVPSSFHVRSWTYHVLPDYPPQTANVLVRGRPVLPEEDAGDDTVNPIAWTTEHTGGGRVFMTTMGHPEDFTVPAFRRLVVNGIHWALGREAPDVAVPGWRVGASSPWVDMDFGPFLSTAIQTAHDDVTYKGLVIPLTEDRHGASTVFDTDLLRFSAGWTDGFIHWEGIVWDGSHGTFPSVAGDLAWTTPEGPGWASEGRFDDPRKQPFGPLPRQWAHWHGVRLDGDEVVLTYSVGTREVRETPTFAHVGGLPTFIRTLTVSPGEQPLTMRVVATRDQPRVEETNHSQRSSWLAVANGAASGARLGAAIVDAPPGVRLAGGESCLLALIPAFDLSVSFSVAIAASYNADARATWLDALGSVPADGRTTSNTAWPEVLTPRGERDIQPPNADQRRALRVTRVREDFVIPVEDGRTARLVPLRGLSLDRSSRASTATHLAVQDPPDEIAAPTVDVHDTDLVGRWLLDEGVGDEPANLVGGSTAIHLDGAGWRRGRHGNALEFNGAARADLVTEGALTFDNSDLTFATWISATSDGTLFAEVSDDKDTWVPGGKSLFIRDGELSFDVGWVGVISGPPNVVDGEWRHIALTWRHDGGAVALYVDGQLIAQDELKPEEPLEESRMQLGFTNDEFPDEKSWWNGRMDDIHLYRRALEEYEVAALYNRQREPFVLAAGVMDAPANARWHLGESGFTLTGADGRDTSIIEWRGPADKLPWFARYVAAGGTDRDQVFAIDRISWPDSTPWASWMRFGAFDFFADGSRAAITTWSGDVWVVAGLDSALTDLRWRRIATGLNQPLGPTIRDDEIYVLGRDQITRLRDENGDGETDFYENFNNDTFNSEHFHEPATGLQTDSEGAFYFMKAARHALRAGHPHHGVLMRVAADGSESTVLARGFRAPNGLGRGPDGTFYATDQEGHWMPANRLNRIRLGGFHGNEWAWTEGATTTSETRPLCWLHPSVDRSPAEPVWIPDGAWGSMAGSMLLLNYGTGKVMAVLTQEVAGVLQAAVTETGVQLPTGTMRGRFNPRDGHLYVCGLVGWSSDQPDAGGFYRVRRTNGPVRHPIGFHAAEDGIVIRFARPLSAEGAEDPASWNVESWDYRISARYGSAEYRRDHMEGRDTHTVLSVTVSRDQKSVFLSIPDIRPVMQFHVAMTTSFQDGGALDNYLHGTLHELADKPAASVLED